MTDSPHRPSTVRLPVLMLAIALLAPATMADAQYDPRFDDQRRGGAQGQGQGESRGFLGGLFGRGDADRDDRDDRDGGRAAGMAAPDLIVRLERLESQIRQLTGAVEQLQFRNQQLEQQVRRFQEDAEDRPADAGARSPRRLPPASRTDVPAAPVPAPARRSDVFDPAEHPEAPGAPQTLGSIATRPAEGRGPASRAPDARSPEARVPDARVPDARLPDARGADGRISDGPSVITGGEPMGGAAGARGPGAPLDLATLAERAAGIGPGDTGPAPPPQREARVVPGALPAPPPRNPNATGGTQLVSAPTASPRDELALGQGYVQRRDYALAEQTLKAFLKKHPEDTLAPDAHFWLGESLFHQQRYRDAAESFLTISTKFEKSGRAPESLLRLGQSLAALGEREAACATLGEVTRKYPRAAQGVRQTVEREQKRVRC